MMLKDMLKLLLVGLSILVPESVNAAISSDTEESLPESLSLTPAPADAASDGLARPPHSPASLRVMTAEELRAMKTMSPEIQDTVRRFAQIICMGGTSVSREELETRLLIPVMEYEKKFQEEQKGWATYCRDASNKYAIVEEEKKKVSASKQLLANEKQKVENLRRELKETKEYSIFFQAEVGELHAQIQDLNDKFAALQFDKLAISQENDKQHDKQSAALQQSEKENAALRAQLEEFESLFGAQKRRKGHLEPSDAENVPPQDFDQIAES